MKHSKYITLGYKYLSSLFNKDDDRVTQILKHLDDNREVFDKLDVLVTEYEQLKVRSNPTVCVARDSDIKTGREYLKAKTFYPMGGGKTKEIRIHLGRSSDFNHDTRNNRAKEFAQIKMRETLKRRKFEGSI